MYQIKFSTQATKFFRKINKNIQERLKEKFNEIALNPYRYIEHYEGSYDKIRIGDFRALVEIDSSEKILWVRVFDKRSRVYK